jgi:crotonobetainyl-CoA:carnitine CoA-transferase CaiB-like acyl-CoA transferase
MTGVLNGVRVLDLSRILAAPLATQMLGDLGAEVVKVERPNIGDDSRQYGPPFLGAPDDRMSAFYLSINRNKQSIALDFTTERGADLLRRLISEADVLVENFRPGVLDKYGFGWDDVHAMAPNLVYCSVTGFGQDGPYKDRAGYDGIFQALSGMMTTSGHPDGVPGAGPMKSGLSLIDIVTGLYASTAIVGAIRHAERTGVGQWLDVSLLDCGIATLSHFAESYLVSGQVPERRGNGGFGGIPSQAFATANGRQFFIVATTNPQFSRACTAIGRPELAIDPRFDSIAHRIENRLALLEILTEVFLTADAEYWLETLEAADVPVAPVNDIAQALRNEQVVHRDVTITMDHPSVGAIPSLRYPIKLSETPIDNYAPPPTLGEDTARVLSRFGLSAEELELLHADGVI